MHSLLYILFSVSLFFVTAPPIAASDGRQSATPEQPTYPSQGGWAATYGGDNIDWAESIQQTDDGRYVATSTRWCCDDWAAEVYLFWVLKLRHDGAVEWQKTYGGVW
ncbi:MAG: hypothetical protein ACYSWY_10445 [Planctomycetota bacterium]|jgi:hypothetical protein